MVAYKTYWGSFQKKKKRRIIFILSEVIKPNKQKQAMTCRFFFLLVLKEILYDLLRIEKEENFRLLKIVVFFWLINCIYKLHWGEIFLKEHPVTLFLREMYFLPLCCGLIQGGPWLIRFGTYEKFVTKY